MILFVGNLVAVKAVDRLLRAFARLDSDRVTLTLIGDGPLRGALEALARDLDIAGRVTVAGRRPHAEIADWMRRAHCLCLCSRSEGMPNVVVEALSCGCPVVATDVGEVPFLVEDGVNGYRIAHETHEKTRKPNGVEAPRTVAEDADAEVVRALAGKLSEALSRDWDRAAIAARMADYTWDNAARTVAAAIEAAEEAHETHERHEKGGGRRTEDRGRMTDDGGRTTDDAFLNTEH